MPGEEETVFVPPGQPPKPSPPDAFDGGDTTGLPPSAGGIRHVPRPQPPKETARGRLAVPGSNADATVVAQPGAPQVSVGADATVVAQPGAPQASEGGDDDGRTRLADEPPSAPGEPTGPLKVGERFGPRYRITRVLGVGGMGAVYEAWDAELGVQVALKVIRPEVAADPSSARELERRFKRELLLARQVTHKNVVRIHDLGEINGIKYITMPYIQGDDLGTILKAEGALPIPRALSITRQALSGLVAAHEKGIVHRDLKPANIMVDTEGNALLMDFGIARSIGVPAEEISPHTHHTAPGAFGETMVGAVVGTIRYMAPEQARGQEVDHRADVYAFGLIIRDMLVGLDRQMGAPTAFAELQQRLDVAPPSVRTIDHAIPEALDRVVSRCLAPEAADRYQSAAELEADLERLDDNGKLKPKKRVVRLPLVAALVILLLALSGGIYWYTRPPVQHEPVAVVIADFVNNTKDPAFDGTLEPMLRRALSEAGFITAYDRIGVRSLGVQPPERFDKAAASTVAANQGLGVVLAGSIDLQGSGYRISVEATRPVAVNGESITTAQGRASSKDQVVEVAVRLMTRIRNALGDDAPESAQQFAGNRISTTSLQVIGLFAKAVEASARNRTEESLDYAEQALKLDPQFGLGYMIAAVQSGTLGRLDEQQQYLDSALKNLGAMTEREQYLTRGYSFLVDNDYEQCVKEYTDAVVRYKAEVSGRNNLALCQSKLRKLPEAVQTMQEVVKILPKQPLFRDNLAVYAAYAGDFPMAEKEAGAVEGPDVYATRAIAFAQLGQGQWAQARKTYEALAQIDERGRSFAASGLGDVAILEGQFSEAVRVLRQGVEDDVAAKNLASAAAKLAAIAHAELSRGEPRAAMAAAKEALGHSSEVTTRFLAGRTYAEAGNKAEAQRLAGLLAKEPFDEPRAYAKIIEGVLALRDGDAGRAVGLLRDANELFDTWIGLFDLGRASLKAGLIPQADSAFGTCLSARRGEALSLFLDEEPTYAFIAEAHYYLGQVREKRGDTQSYRAYLDLRGRSKEDPLVEQVRKLVGQ